MKNLKVVLVAFVSVFMFNSCSNDDSPVVEEEVITTAIVTLTGGGETITLTSRDLDGDGPNPPVLTITGNLSVNTTYSGMIQFLNELESPAEDITEEIEEKDLEHQVFYQITNTLGSFTYLDFDTEGKPLGLLFNFTTGATPGNGNLTITLRHLLNKNASGVSSGDITNAGGSTDVLVTFPVVLN